MTIGYLAAGQCWETASEATDAYYSSIAPTVTGYRDDGSTAIGKYHVMRYFKSGVWYESHAECNHQYTSATCYSYNIAAPSAVYGSCTMPVVSTSSSGAAVETGLPADFDYSILGAVFAFAVSVVVAMYVLGRGAGVVLSVFRK